MQAPRYVSWVRNRAAPAIGQVRRFERDLRRLHDVVASTALADRYWVWGGLLIGWAREGRVLPYDCRDADFAFDSADRGAFHQAARALMDSGFDPLYRFINNDGDATEYSFMRNGAKFEFFECQPVDGRMRYHVYGASDPGGQPTQGLAEVSAQQLEVFSFIGRRWRKPRDHDLALSESYGDWRRPDSSWNYMNDLAIRSRAAWRGTDYEWSGDLPPLG